ncbi:MAG: FAD-dependent oxidoreductase [Nevskiales bacterium]
MNKSRVLLLLVVVAAIAAFFHYDLNSQFTLANFKAQQAAIMDFYTANRALTVGAFFAVYVAVTGLSLPGAAVMTLAAGALFGLLWGVVIVSFASTIGATTAFLVSRFILREWVQKKFADRLRPFNRGVEKDGAFYLFALRLVPAVPFFVINLVMGLTPIKTLVFYAVSQVGMLPGTVVYVFAGTRIAEIDSLGGIFSADIIAAFVLLAIFPFLARKLLDWIKAGRIYRGYKRPRKFDTNLIVIGAGSAGLVSAYIAAAVKAKVTLIEKNKMGGDCLNTGCVPSKALIRSAKFRSHIRRANEFGFKNAAAEFDFADVMERVQSVVKAIEPHDSIARYTELGVDCVQGDACLVSPWTVEVNGQRISAPKIIIASGAEPFVPSIPGLAEVGYLTSDNVWELRELPRRLVVLGGGSIGSELTQTFARLGAKVTQVEMLDRIMAKEDPDVSEQLQKQFDAEGIQVLTGHKAKEVRLLQGEKTLICEYMGDDIEVPFDQILVAVGRKARLEGFGLDELGVELDRTVVVDAFMRTNFPNIFACGDVAGPYQFTHTAAHQAWYAAVNALFGGIKKFKADYSVIPWATFTEPEVATVGLTETAASAQGIDYEVTRFGIDDLDRAIADSEAHGFVKVLTVPGKDKILGVTIVGEHAGDLIAEYVLAMRYKIGLNKILGTIHIYPTLAEANKYAAGEWKKAHAPELALKLLERFHRWSRG